MIEYRGIAGLSIREIAEKISNGEPMEEAPRSAVSLIRTAGTKTFANSPLKANAKSRQVSFSYTRKSDGKTSKYAVEPYEFRKNVFWAYHPKHKSIHSFIWPRVKPASVKINNAKASTFKKRWPMKLDKTPATSPKNRALVRPYGNGRQ